MMDGVKDAAIIVGMFLLRLGVPLVITLIVAYLFRRLDARWEAEAQARPEAIRQLEAATAKKRCWEEKGCSQEQRARCPACRLTDIPCWLARLRVENRLPNECLNCPRYRGLAPVPV